MNSSKQITLSCSLPKMGRSQYSANGFSVKMRNLNDNMAVSSLQRGLSGLDSVKAEGKVSYVLRSLRHTSGAWS